MDKARQSGGFLQVGKGGLIKRGGWWTYCPAQRSWDGLVGGQVAFPPGFSSLDLDKWMCSFGCREYVVDACWLCLVEITHAGLLHDIQVGRFLKKSSISGIGVVS